MYVGHDVAWVDFHGVPLVLPLTEFDDQKPATDQIVETLKKRLEDFCWLHLERMLGFLPTGTISVKDDFDPNYRVTVYRAYFNGFTP